MYIASEILFNDKLFIYIIKSPTVWECDFSMCVCVCVRKMITSVCDGMKMIWMLMRWAQAFSFHFSSFGRAWLCFVLFIFMVINLSEKIKTNELMLLCPYNEIYIYWKSIYTHTELYRCSERKRKRFIDCAVFKWYRGHILSALKHTNTQQMTTDHLFWQPAPTTLYTILSILLISVCVWFGVSISLSSIYLYNRLTKKTEKKIYFAFLKIWRKNSITYFLFGYACFVVMFFLFLLKAKLPLLLLLLLFDWNWNENCSQFDLTRHQIEILITNSFQFRNCNRVSLYLMKDNNKQI